MMVPTVHLNGTSKESLLEGWKKAYLALLDARARLCEAAPNGRDYYPQGPDAYYTARDEHQARVSAITKVMDEIDELSSAIYFDRNS